MTDKKIPVRERHSKSHILSRISWAINHFENLEAEYIENKTQKVIKVTLKIEDLEVFIDSNGVEWIRK